MVLVRTMYPRSLVVATLVLRQEPKNESKTSRDCWGMNRLTDIFGVVLPRSQ